MELLFQRKVWFSSRNFRTSGPIPNDSVSWLFNRYTKLRRQTKFTWKRGSSRGKQSLWHVHSNMIATFEHRFESQSYSEKKLDAWKLEKSSWLLHYYHQKCLPISSYFHFFIGGTTPNPGGREAPKEDRWLRGQAERVPAWLHPDEVLPVQVSKAVRVFGSSQQDDHQHGGWDVTSFGIEKSYTRALKGVIHPYMTSHILLQRHVLKQNLWPSLPLKEDVIYGRPLNASYLVIQLTMDNLVFCQ